MLTNPLAVISGGSLLVCVIIGTLSALLFWIFDLKYPLLLGLIIAATNVIPYFGPIIGAVPAVIIAATTSGKLVFITLAIVFGLQFIEGNILSPYIVGKSLHMHPLMIMAALTGGGEIGGIIGMILAVPVLAILKWYYSCEKSFHATKTKEPPHKLKIYIDKRFCVAIILYRILYEHVEGSSML